ncbi:MAG: nucleoside-diphosphate kinase [Candidatus Hydrogenedentes bacterium]|nr:nucleoside-diphosphate kinase [Candidatus Hydrogenedentota bacterium]
MPKERTFVMIKPDGVARKLVGECIKRLEQRGFKLVAIKMQVLTRAKAEEHYIEHKGKDFYESLINFIISGPTIQMVWEGEEAVSQIRAMVGSTNPLEASPGTIRGDFALITQKNVIHASDSIQSAEREIALYFLPEEIVEYSVGDDKWMTSM